MNQDHKICKACGKTFNRPFRRYASTGKFYLLPVTLWSKRNYCSNECGRKPGSANETHGSWKGEEAGYSAIHRWIRRHAGRPKVCRDCLKPNNASGPSIIEWSSDDHSYTRDLNSWTPRCRACHAQHDRAEGLRWAA